MYRYGARLTSEDHRCSYMVNEQAQLQSAVQLHVDRLESESDEALAVRGDTDSFVLLYRRHVRPVYSYSYVRLANRQEAEDVTSMAFERAWQSLPRFKPTGTFKAWLLTIASRALVDHQRGKKSPSVPLGTLADAIEDPSAGPEEAALISEQMRLAMRIISELGREQQEVISLRFMAGLQYKEVALIMGKKEAAVKMLAYRALEEVRRRHSDVLEEI